MNLTKPLKLDILYDNKEDLNLLEMGVEIKVKTMIRTVIFYSIDTLRSLEFDDGNSKACISSGGTDYIANLTMQEVEKLINDNL